MTTYIIHYFNDSGEMGGTLQRMEYRSSQDKEGAKATWQELHQKFTFLSIIYKV